MCGSSVLGSHVTRDSLVSVQYSEELNSIMLSATYQRTTQQGMLGQKPTDFQRVL
jgi:hypothetical protein